MAPPHLEDLESLISGPLAQFLKHSKEIGDPVETMGKNVEKTFQALVDFIKKGIFMEKPADGFIFSGKSGKIRESLSVWGKIKHDLKKTAYAQCFEPLNVLIASIQEFRSSHRNDKFFDHLSIVSESVSAFVWIAMEPAPAQFIRDMKESGEYYGIRVLKNFKGNQVYSNWVNSWYQVLKELETYVRKHHTTGFTWGLESRKKPQPPLNAPCIPPPPPPALGSFGFIPTSEKEYDDERAALLRDLNSGTDITKRLKKVDLQSPSSKSIKPGYGSGSAQQAAGKKVHEPKYLLEGKKWCIEYQKGNSDLEVTDPRMSESVSMYKCEFCVLRVYKKINNITIDSCKKVSLILSDIISSVEVIHCDSIEIQCNGRVPLINVDGSDGIQIYTNDESFNVELVSSKSSAINISALTLKGDYVEMAVPEQIRTFIGPDRDKILSNVIEKN